MNIRRLGVATTVLALAASVAGCINPQHSLNRDWALATRTNLAAQTADPEAKYLRELNPASNGPRAADASRRYNRGEVIQPASMTTSSTLGSSAAPASAGAASGASR